MNPLILDQTVSFALVDLCTYREYTSSLREELVEGWDDFAREAKGLPLLDSFLKESTRLNGTEAGTSPLSYHAHASSVLTDIPVVSGRRKALEPFTFTDGPRVPAGSWIYIPTGSINRDPKFFQDPLHFDGFRFAKGDKPTSFTDTTGNWRLWGTGHVVW